MNNDLISRSALKEEFNTISSKSPLGGMELIPICSFISFIDNAPTVEQSYQEPKDYIKNKLDYSRPKGEWLESDIPESLLAKCSICGFDCGAYTHNFCPNCGAKMQKGGAK